MRQTGHIDLIGTSAVINELRAEIEHALDRYECHGRITTGCGGGYAILATDQDVSEGFRVKVKR